jgi:hypothetical protein
LNPKSAEKSPLPFFDFFRTLADTALSGSVAVVTRSSAVAKGTGFRQHDLFNISLFFRHSLGHAFSGSVAIGAFSASSELNTLALRLLTKRTFLRIVPRFRFLVACANRGRSGNGPCQEFPAVHIFFFHNNSLSLFQF